MKFCCLIFVGAFAASATAQASTKIPIREHVEAHGQIVTLADLTASDSLADNDAHLGITTAPQLDSTRTMSRHEMSALLLAHNQTPSDFNIPERIQIARWSRSLSSQELMDAIDTALTAQKMTIVFEGELRGGSKVGIRDPKVQVTSIDLSRAENSIRFRLRVVNEPELHEFWVTSHLAGSVAGPQNVRFDLRAARSSSSAAPRIERPIVLVKAMKPASLIVYGRGFQFTSPVTPLQNGARGDLIRVREDATGHIFKAEVIGPSQLQIGDQVAN
jgi:Chaperone for flagella basal body P-ring formation